jgi:hypothetical protein
MTMHPRTTELFAELDSRFAQLREAYAAVPPQRRMTRPAPDRWSSAEVLGHLAIVERRIAKRIADAADAANLPPESDTSPVLPFKHLDRAIGRGEKRVAPEPTHPVNVNPDRAWTEYEAARQHLKSTILERDGRALGQITMPHPAFGEMTGYEWVAFTAAHCARHAAQIAENEAILTAAVSTEN